MVADIIRTYYSSKYISKTFTKFLYSIPNIVLLVQLQDFIITVAGQNANPSQFGEYSSALEVTLDPGFHEITEDFSVIEGIVTEDDNGNIISAVLINVLDGQITFSEDCSGTIEADETKTCTITNPVRID